MSDQKLITLVIGVITSLVAGWLGYDNTASVTAERMQGRVIAVSDGDTLTLLVGVQEHRIRLGGVDAPESDQAHGTRSRATLASLCLGRQADITVEDRDRYGRTVGQVRCGNTDVNAELVRRGDAWVYRAYNKHPELEDLERSAKASRRGLWAQSRPTPPWEWRQDKR